MARRYEFCVLVAKTVSHSFASLTREILFLPLEHKIHIFSPPCNILYKHVISYGDIILISGYPFWELSIDHNMDVQYQVVGPHISKLARMCEISHWLPCGADGRSDGRTVT